ncbi:hypothetical protein ACIOD2_27270 [Amycolatopsis sp. NPDC088138]|uniref:hypothetical protein n=1 Tax=Amycolatopsis sp. NPDC088138 TaxID=3363938 RepID=UPI00382935FB
MTDAWHERLSFVGWFFEHLDDVLSDMSVFHRIDELDQLPAAVFLPRMVRLVRYDGAVRHTMLRVAEETPASTSRQAQSAPVRTHTTEELKALNQTREYGPQGVNQASVFQFG